MATDDPKSIFLVGMMGAGKTTVGKPLARRLGKEFVDSDHEIEARTGVKIPVIFEVEGEAGFRKRECEMLDALTQRSDIVLATGGGAVTNCETRRHLRERGFTIYISSTASELFKRISNDRSRPMMNAADPYARLQELLNVREPMYREVADMVIETGRPSVGKVVARIIRELSSRPGCAGLVAAMADSGPPDADG